MTTPAAAARLLERSAGHQSDRLGASIVMVGTRQNHRRYAQPQPLVACGVLEKLMLVRIPAGRACLGTRCRQSVWQRPPITTRSPSVGVSTMLDPAGAGLEQKPTRRAESQYGDYAFVPFARRPVAVPPGAVVVVAVEVDPNAVIGNAVVVRQMFCASTGNNGLRASTRGWRSPR